MPTGKSTSESAPLNLNLNKTNTGRCVDVGWRLEQRMVSKGLYTTYSFAYRLPTFTKVDVLTYSTTPKGLGPVKFGRVIYALGNVPPCKEARKVDGMHTKMWLCYTGYTITEVFVGVG